MRKWNGLTIYISLRGMTSLLFATIFTIAPLYRINQAGMNPFQLALVGMVLEATIFLFEIPTGILADNYSRRLSIIIGVFLLGLASILEGSLPYVLPIVLVQIIWGFGYTFTSGATDAWLIDEIGEDRATMAFIRGAQAGQIGALVGIFLGVVLAGVQLSLPIWLGGLAMVGLGGFLALTMPETNFVPAPREDRTSWQQMRHTFSDGSNVVRRRPMLMAILAIGMLAGAGSEGLDRLWEYHFNTNFVFPALGGLSPLVWFGIINAGAMLLSLIATEVISRRIEVTNQRTLARTLMGLDALLIVSVIGFGLAGNFALAVATYWMAVMLRVTNSPLYSIWLNRNIPSHVRATVLSMNSQLDALGQIGGGPVIGLIGNFSIRIAIMTTGLFLAPALLIYRYTLALGRRQDREAETEPGPGE